MWKIGQGRLHCQHGAACQDFFTFFGRRTGPKRSGAVLACFWTDFQPEPLILDPIRAVFDDLCPNRHFGRDLASPWPGQVQALHTHGGRDSGRLSLSVRTRLAEAAAAADLKGGSGEASPPQEKKVLTCFGLLELGRGTYGGSGSSMQRMLDRFSDTLVRVMPRAISRNLSREKYNSPSLRR